MAKSNNFRSFNDGGTTVSFSSIRFRNVLRTWQATQRESTGVKPSLDEVYKMIADGVHVSPEAVRNWDRGHNGVNDFEMIKEIAEILEIDYKDLIVSNEEVNDSVKTSVSFDPVSNDEKDLILQFYRLFIDFIYFFCGTLDDCYANHVMETPYDEKDKYISKLHHLLDQSALSISRDTYLKLRKTISEINVMANVYGSGCIYIPDPWVQANKRFLSSEFRYILTDSADMPSVLSSEYLTGKEKDGLFHMMIEDIPEVIDELSSSMYEFSKKKKKMVSKIADGFCVLWHGNIIPLYEIISHEIAYTLTDIMRVRFPQYFSEK